MSAAAGSWVRSELRRHGRAVLALTVLCGLVGASVLAAFAGARRTVTAFDRFGDRTRMSHARLQLTNNLAGRSDVDLGGGLTADEVIAELRQRPEVERLGVSAIVHAAPDGFEPGGDFYSVAYLDGGPAPDADRVRVLDGRMPAAEGELALNESAARALGKRVGDQLTLRSRTPEQMQRLIFEGDVSVGKEPAGGPTVSGRVVGIVRSPSDVGARNLSLPSAVISARTAMKHRGAMSQFAPMVGVRLRNGYRDLPKLNETVEELTGGDEEASVQDQREDVDAVNEAVGVQAIALVLFGVVVAAAGAVAVATATSRQLRISAADGFVLRALGLTRRERAAALGATLTPVAIGAPLLAVAGALAASPLLPTGLAGIAEPDPGLAFDRLVLPAGTLVFFLAVVTAVACLAWRASRTMPEAAGDAGRAAPSFVNRGISAFGLGAVAATGLRYAFDPGRRGTALPVRSALAGAVLAVAGIAAAAAFGSSLTHLTDTPALSGFPWDAEIGGGENEESIARTVDTAAADPDMAGVLVARVALVTIGNEVVQGYGTRAVKGETGLTVLTGRAPSAADEVALGPETLRRLETAIGKTVAAQTEDGAREFRVVGTVIFPIVESADYANGSHFTMEGMRGLAQSEGFYNIFGRFADGVDADAKRAALEREVGFLYDVEIPARVANLEQADGFPEALAAFLGLLGLTVAAHALLSVPRQRRRELAVLRAVGFVRHQVRATVAIQATAIAVTGLLVGLPVGLAVGRWSWRVVVEGLFVAERVIIPASLGLVVPAALLVVNLAAAVPARRAAALAPAEVLRTE